MSRLNARIVGKIVSSILNIYIKLFFLSRDGIVISFADGTIQKLKDGEIVKSVQPSATETMIKVINDEIVATTDGYVLVLNGELETVRTFNNEHFCADCIDGNEKYIAA